MNQAEFTNILEDLETFILLKKQHLIIYAWMEFKKINKRILSMRHSKASSYDFRVLKQMDYLVPQKTKNNETFRCITPKNSPPKIHKRLATQNPIPNNQYMFQTFNKDRHQTLNPLTKKTAFQYPNQHQNDDVEFEDSDQFEDIVLDRLSKLQESVNKMMNEKRRKEENRETIGLPIFNPYIYSKYKPFQQPTFLKNPEFQPFAHFQLSDIKNRKKRCYQSLQLQNQDHKVNNNAKYHLKYIPVGRQSQLVNIRKIREIMENNYDLQEDDLIDGVQFFNQNNIRQSDEFNKWKTNFRSYVTSRKVQEKSNLEQQNKSRQQVCSNTLFMNRYQGRNLQKNQVYYIPENIQIQSAIHNRKRYNRNPQKLLKDQMKNDHFFDGRQIYSKRSGVSSQISKASNRTSKAHNLTSYY